MPARPTFTRPCQQLAAGPPPSGRADLHLHTTHSDGTYTPAEVVALARRSGLSAVAVTDHDTTGGVAGACAAAPAGVEVIAGVEVTAGHDGREVHLLGYFVRPDDPALCAALADLRAHRRERFHAMVGRLRDRGVSVEDGELPGHDGPAALGRRTLAVLLERTGQVGSVREAFTRYLADDGPVNLPKARLPLQEAIRLVRAAGGVTSLAHPS